MWRFRHTNVINRRDRGRKEDAVSRTTVGFPGVLAGLAASLAAPSIAFADVMEINGSQVNWIAGAPASARVLAAAQGESGETAPSEGAVGAHDAPPQTAALSYTAVSDAAGPAQWRARVRELAAKYDISPNLLEAVVWQESRWNTQAVSPVGARGLAQLMPGTARELGVNPHDPHANLEGGARYLRAQLDRFKGDVEKALAAYNAGPGRVQRAGGIPAIRETQDYVVSIMSRLSSPVRR